MAADSLWRFPVDALRSLTCIYHGTTALSYHFVPGTSYDNFFDETEDHGRSVLLSSATELSSFKDHSMPFPIIVTNTYTPNTRDT